MTTFQSAALVMLALCVAAGSTVSAGQSQPATGQPIARAVAYLEVEVPRWRREHPCYSCHNNGDAVRALIAASARGHTIGNGIDDSLAWLATPERWDSNQRRGGSEELPLARIQFASALAAMVSAGRAQPDALDRAAALLVVHQQDDGSWRLSESQTLGGATFYGTSLATAIVRRTLSGTKTPASEPLARANAWLRSTGITTVLDASSVLFGLDGDRDAAAIAQRQKCLDVLKRGQAPDGGWGPYVTSQSEPFDTALAVLALLVAPKPQFPPASNSAREVNQMISRAKDYLVSSQNPDGSWPETTRPPNGESYAQRISTTAWALLALLEIGA